MCSAFQNEINVPGNSGESAGETTEQLPEQVFESSSPTSSESESDNDEDNYSVTSISQGPGTSCSSVDGTDSAVSSDFGTVVQLKATRKLKDHEKLALLSAHFVPPRHYKLHRHPRRLLLSNPITD